MNRAERNLFLAKWVYPDYEWHVMPDGRAFAKLLTEPKSHEFFSLDNPRDVEMVLAKLKLAHGWTIKQVKRDHKDVWQAKKGGSSIEKPVLDGLLYDVVKRVVGGG
jgi:hypothetical protein